MSLRVFSLITSGNRNAVRIIYHEIIFKNLEKELIRTNVNICGKSMEFIYCS